MAMMLTINNKINLIETGNAHRGGSTVSSLGTHSYTRDHDSNPAFVGDGRERFHKKTFQQGFKVSKAHSRVVTRANVLKHRSMK